MPERSGPGMPAPAPRAEPAPRPEDRVGQLIAEAMRERRVQVSG